MNSSPETATTSLLRFEPRLFVPESSTLTARLPSHQPPCILLIHVLCFIVCYRRMSAAWSMTRSYMTAPGNNSSDSEMRLARRREQNRLAARRSRDRHKNLVAYYLQVNAARKPFVFRESDSTSSSRSQGCEQDRDPTVLIGLDP